MAARISDLIKKLTPPQDDERGVYGVFTIILMPILLVVLGVAIDGPRQLTVFQRTEDVAEQAARYAAGLIATDAGNFQRVRELTNDFVATQSSGTFAARNLRLTALSCDAENGEIVAVIRGSLINTFSGLIFGVERTFNSSARSSLTFLPPGGSETGPLSQLCQIDDL